MSKTDQSFVKSIDLSYASVAALLGMSRQAISRGVKNSKENYFGAGALSRILANYEANDPIMYQLARKSVAKLYPNISDDIFQLIDARGDAKFDPELSGDYTIVTADFVRLMGELKACSLELKSLVRSLELQPGTLTIIVGPHDLNAAKKFKDGCNALDAVDQRIFIKSCDIDLSLFPTSVMRIDEDFGVDIFIAKNGGFDPLESVEADRIKTNIVRLAQAETIH